MGKFLTKRVLPVILIAALLMTMSFTTFAEGNGIVTLNASSYDDDGYFTIDVAIQNNPGIDSFTWRLTYPSEYVEPVYDAETFWGDVVAGGTNETNLADSGYVQGTPVTAVFAKADGTNLNGSVFTVKFLAKAAAVEQTLNFSLDITDTVADGEILTDPIEIDGPAKKIPVFSTFKVKSLGADYVTLGWSFADNGAELSTSEIFRNGVSIATTSATTYKDEGLSEETSYVYKIVNGEGESVELNVTTAKTGEKAYNLSFIPGGTNQSRTFAYDLTEIVLPEGEGYVREGYTFAGWTVDGSTILPAGTIYSVTGTTVFQAVWSKTLTPKDTVLYRAYSKSGDVVTPMEYPVIDVNYEGMSPLGRNDGSILYTEYNNTLPSGFFKATYSWYTLQKSGYCYLYLYDVDSTAFESAFGDILVPEYANTLNIALADYDLELPEKAETHFYKSSSKLDATTKYARTAEHTITNYVANAGQKFTIAATLVDGNTTPDGSRMYPTQTVVTAYYLAEPEDTTGKIVVTFDKAGGKANYSSFVVEEGTTIVLPEAPVYAARRFLGWSDGETVYDPDTEITVNESMTFTALWEYVGGTAEVAPSSVYFVNYDSVNNEVLSVEDFSNSTGYYAMASNTAANDGMDRYMIRTYDLSDFVNVQSVKYNNEIYKIVRQSTTTIKPVVSGLEIPVTAENFANIVKGDSLVSKVLSKTTNLVDGEYVPFTEVYDFTDYILNNNLTTITLVERAFNWDSERENKSGSPDAYSPYIQQTLTVKSISGKKASFLGGSGAFGAMEDIYADENGQVVLPECTFTVPGKAFAGWKAEGEAAHPAGYVATLSENKTYTAQWGDAVTVTLNKASNVERIGIVQGSDYTLPSANLTASIGTYTFKGWLGQDGVEYNAGDVIQNVTANTSFTAMYDYEGVSEAVSFPIADSLYRASAPNSDGVTINAVNKVNETFRVGYTTRAASSTNSRAAVVIPIDLTKERPAASATLHYSIMANNSSDTYFYVAETNKLPEVGESLTSIYGAATEIGRSIAVNTNGTRSTVADMDITQFYNKNIGKVGYLFITGLNNAQRYEDTLTVYIDALAINVTTLNEISAFFTTGAQAVSTADGNITFPAYMGETPEGKTFGGWTDGVNTYAAGAAGTIEETTLFSPTFVAGYTVTYYGADIVPASLTEGQSVTLPSAEKEGYTFAGWSDGTATYSAGDVVTPDSDMNLVALWGSAGSDATLSFDNNLLIYGNYAGGAVTASSNVTGDAGIYYLTSASSSNSSYNRGMFFAEIDLTSAAPATSATLSFDFTTTSAGGSAQMRPTIAEYVSEELPDATTITDLRTFRSSIFTTEGTITNNNVYSYKGTVSGTEVYDITDMYNSNIGGKLIIAFVADSANSNGKHYNVGLLKTNTLQIEVTSASAQYASFDKGSEPVAITDGAVTLPAYTGDAPAGKVFAGWSDGSSVYPAGAVVELEAPTAFFATYGDAVKLLFQGDGTYEEVYVAENSEYTVRNYGFTKDGYTFFGYKLSDGTRDGKYYAVGDTVPVETNLLTFTAVFAKNIPISAKYVTMSDGTVVNVGERTSLGRNNGTYLFTDFDLSALTLVPDRISINFKQAMQQTGYCHLVAYPVTGDYATAFAGIEPGEMTTEAVDLSGLTISDTIVGDTAVTRPNFYTSSALIATSDWRSLSYYLYDLDDYFADLVHNRKDTAKLAFALLGGNPSSDGDGLRYYNDSSRPVTATAYYLADAAAIEIIPEPTATVNSFESTANTHDTVELAWDVTVENAENYDIVILRDWEEYQTISDKSTSFTDTELDAETEYTYQIEVRVDGETLATSDEIAVTTDEVPAAVPSATINSFESTANTDTTIRLDWDITVENAEEYDIVILRDWEEYETVSGETTSFTDSGLTPETEYAYQIIVKVNDETLAESEEIAVTTDAAAVVPVVTFTSFSVPNGDLTYASARLAWTTSVENTEITGFEVYRNNVKIADVAANAVEYVDNTVSAATEYTYYVKAVYAEGSVDSDAQVVTTLAAPVVTIDSTTVSAIKYNGATVTWTSTVANTTAVYDVYVNGTLVASDLTEKSYVITGLTAETAYTVKVVAKYETSLTAEGTTENFTTVAAPVVTDDRVVKVGSYWKFFPDGDTSSTPATGMWVVDGYQYYFSTSSTKYGAALTSTTTLKGKSYYFQSSTGKMLTGSGGTPVFHDTEATATIGTTTLTQTTADINFTLGVKFGKITSYDVYRDGVLIDTIEVNIDATALEGPYMANPNTGLNEYYFAPVTNNFQFSDTGLDQNTEYTYRIVANYEGGSAEATKAITTKPYASKYVQYDKVKNQWYCLLEDGETRRTGYYLTPDGFEYYFSTSSTKYGAALASQYTKIPGTTRYAYFSPYGAIYNDNDGSKTYTEGDTFVKKYDGFITEGSVTRYYASATENPENYVTGWLRKSKQKYYLSKATGNVLKGAKVQIGSEFYNLDTTDGHWVGYYEGDLSDDAPYATALVKGADNNYRYYPNGTDNDPLGGAWKVLVTPNGDYQKYYFSKSSTKYGALLTGYNVQVGGEFFNFTPTGALIEVTKSPVDYTADVHVYKLSAEQGAKNGVMLDADGFYRYYIDGEAQTGWQEVDGYKYYFKRDTTAKVGAHQKVGSYYYDFDDQGRLLSK